VDEGKPLVVGLGEGKRVPVDGEDMQPHRAWRAPGGATVAGAYTRPLFGKTKALSVGQGVHSGFVRSV